MHPEPGQKIGDVPAHDHEFTLGQVLDVHHPPYEGEAVSGQGEYRADEYPVQQKLDIEDRCDLQYGEVVEHGAVSDISSHS